MSNLTHFQEEIVHLFPQNEALRGKSINTISVWVIEDNEINLVFFYSNLLDKPVIK